MEDNLLEKWYCKDCDADWIEDDIDECPNCGSRQIDTE